jgi:PhnB protein
MTNVQALKKPQNKTAAAADLHARPAITPHLVVAGAAEAIEFYKKAFGATEMMRIPAENGKLMHAAVQINGAMVMLVDEMPQWGVVSPKTLKGSPVTIHLYVDDTDAFMAHAVAAGATIKMPAADMFWGDRYGVITDPFGHSWSIATPQREVSADELREAVKNMPQTDCGAAAAKG